MRYSIIHHEVREIFSLTIAEYMVCDSIQQLSYRKPFTKPLNQIAYFLGFSEKTIWRARDVLVEKGLVENINEGYQVTDKWIDEVTNKADKMSGGTGQNVRSTPDKMSGVYNIYTKEDKSPAKAEEVCDDVSFETVDSEGSEIEPRKKREPSMEKDIRALFGLFANINPAFMMWRIMPPQRDAAKILLTKYGLEKTQRLLDASQRVKNEPFAPKVDSPYDLLNKLSKLKSHEERGD